ncbi:MAG: hypothetical protein IAE79_19830 [Anaerolinea sp.]|nr:hypothetical protein [Anaerolinea sp.]
MKNLKVLFLFFLIWSAITALFTIIAAMRSAQLSRREEEVAARRPFS